MKKITLICLLLAISFVGSVQAQDFPFLEGTYRLRAIANDNYITIPNRNAIPDEERVSLMFAPLDDTNNNQIFTIRPTADSPVGEEGEPLDYYIEAVTEGQGALVFLEPDVQNTRIAIVADDPEVAGADAVWFFRDGNKIFNRFRVGTAALRRVGNNQGTVNVGGGGGELFAFEPATPLVLSTDSNELSSNDFFVSNPVNNVLEISSNVTKINQVEVYSLLGNKVLTQSTDALSATKMNVASLSAGVYILKVDSSKGIFSTKVIKQ